MKNILEFGKMREENRPITMVTCYDYTFAKIINESDIDAVLIGDSVSMVVHGYETTVNANLNMILSHLEAVKRGLNNKFIIADFPFLAHRRGIKELIDSVDLLVKAGAQAIKIEGADDNIDAISYVIKSGVPVMGHLGLTPQSVHSIGGFRVQGKDDKTAKKLIDDAKILEETGCFAMVLELIPTDLAKKITEAVSIPTIGIGAGPFTSGQILVLHDLLGLSKAFQPKFLRKYLNGYDLIKNALNTYNNDVKTRKFPNGEESY